MRLQKLFNLAEHSSRSAGGKKKTKNTIYKYGSPFLKMFRTFAFETSEATFETSEANSARAERAKRTYTHLYTPRPRAAKLPRYWLAKKSKSGKETLSKWRKAREISLNINRSTITIKMGKYARSIINFNWNFGNLKSMAIEKRRANTAAINYAKSRQAARKRNGRRNQGPGIISAQEHVRAATQWHWQEIAEQMVIENKFYKNIGLSAPLIRQLAKEWEDNVLFEKLTEQVLKRIPNYSLWQFQPNAITNFVTNKDLVLKKLYSKKGKRFDAGCSGTIVKLRKQGNVQFVVFMENEKKAKFLINPDDLFAPFIKAMAYGLFMKIFEIIPSANFEETIKYNEIFSDWRRKYDINYRRKQYGKGHQYSAVEIAS